MANDIVFTNNASALLAATIVPADLIIQVAAGFGANFPAPSGGKFFYATLEDDAGNIEIVQCTSRTGDNLTVVRAQDGTIALGFTNTVTRVEIRLVKIIMEEFLQKNGGTMTGDVDFNQNTITDPYISGANARMTAGQIVGVPLRGDLGVSSNEVVVPSGGGRATVGAAQILAQGDDIVAELDAAGIITLDSATIGVRIPTGAYLRIADAGDTDWMQAFHDGTDFNFNFTNTDEVNWDALLSMSADLQLNDNDLIRPTFLDFSLKKQTIAATATTSIDYEAGSYAIITMGTDITLLQLQNPPGTDVGVFRLKFVQDATGGRTIVWPAGLRWIDGVVMVLSTAANAVDFIDIWTDDGGTTWYAGYNNNWSA